MAVEIPIQNHSFEGLSIPDNYYTVNVIPGWRGEGSWHHVANPTDANFAGATDGDENPGTIDGLNAVAVNNYGHILYQQLSETVQPNTTYTLNLLVGHRIGVPFDQSSVNLIAGDRFLVREFPNPPEGLFVPITIEYNSPASGAVIGQPLVIELRSAGDIAQGWFDDVHLFADPSAAGTVPDADTPYVPIPPDHPHYATAPYEWPNLVMFGGGGTLDFPTAPASVPDGGPGMVAWVLCLVGLSTMRRAQ